MKKIKAHIGLKFVSLIDLSKNHVMLIVFNENSRTKKYILFAFKIQIDHKNTKKKYEPY